MKPNPLRVDPTRTTDIRRRFAAEVRRRFLLLQRDIDDLVVKEDAFGIGTDRIMPGGLPAERVENVRWFFATATEKVKAFLKWVKERVDFHLLGNSQSEVDAGFWDQYLKEAMLRGRGRAFEDAIRKYGTGNLPFTAQTKSDFLRSAFSQPVPVERAKQLASRTLTDLKGVTEAMATDMSRTLLDGFARGEHPRDIAKDLAASVDGIGVKRGELIARTEVVRAHAEGQLDALEEFGVSQVEPLVEWSTAGDGRVCPLCAPLNKLVLTVKEARGMLPRHPQCRCAWIPAGVGEDPKGQKRGLKEAGTALLRSIDAETKRGTIKEKIRRSKWAGAGVRLKKRG